METTVTRTLYETMQRDPATNAAVLEALRLFAADDWGEVPQEDKEANDRDKAAGVGRILARYKTPSRDIYITQYPGSDSPASVMYCREY